MLLGGVLLFLAGIALSVVGGVLGLFALIPVGVVLFIASLPLLMGLTLVQPESSPSSATSRKLVQRHLAHAGTAMDKSADGPSIDLDAHPKP